MENTACWAGDLHFDQANDAAIADFARKVTDQDSKVVLLGGDISNSTAIVRHLKYLSKAWNDKQIYFVLGNHDYYGGSIKEIREVVREYTNKISNLHWLDYCGPVKLSDQTALVGNGLWCDWRAGKAEQSTVWLNDYLLIEELIFQGAPYNKLAHKWTRDAVRKYAGLFTTQLLKDFKKVLKQGFKNIIILTHVPPFHEGSFFDGKVQDGDFAAHFVCYIAGAEIRNEIKNKTDVDVLILSSHTHGYGKADILPNLHTIGSKARYGSPELQELIYFK